MASFPLRSRLALEYATGQALPIEDKSRSRAPTPTAQTQETGSTSHGNLLLLATAASLVDNVFLHPLVCCRGYRADRLSSPLTRVPKGGSVVGHGESANVRTPGPSGWRSVPCADRAGLTDQPAFSEANRSCLRCCTIAGVSRQSFRRNLHRSNRSLQCQHTGGRRARRRNSERKVRTPTAVARVPLVAERKLTSTGAVRLALEAGVDIVYLNSFGTPVGRIFSSSPKGIAELAKLRLCFHLAESPGAFEDLVGRQGHKSSGASSAAGAPVPCFIHPRDRAM